MTVRHKVSKSCWSSAACRARFLEQWRRRGQVFLYTEPIASNPHSLWAVFEQS